MCLSHLGTERADGTSLRIDIITIKVSVKMCWHNTETDFVWYPQVIFTLQYVAYLDLQNIKMSK
jgi:hypothetical protein